MHIILIAAVAFNRVIGRRGALVWRHDEDMRRFRQLTLGHAVLMGRKTWESLPERFRPLPGRFNLILTRTPFATTSENVLTVSSIDQAIEEAAKRGHTTLYVIGGGELYRATIDRATRLELTEIGASLEGDTFFPEYRDHWTVLACETREGFTFTTFTRNEVIPCPHPSSTSRAATETENPPP
jgi:dihydrofolate reductase